MSTLSLKMNLPDHLQRFVEGKMKKQGFRATEDYVSSLIEADCARDGVDAVIQHELDTGEDASGVEAANLEEVRERMLRIREGKATFYPLEELDELTDPSNL